MMAELKEPVCSLANRPKTFRQNGYNFVDGEFVAKQDSYNNGQVKSHRPTIFKQKEKYYV